MAIEENIDKDLREALKKKDEITVSTLRMLKSALHNKEIEKKHQALTDDEVVKVIAKQIQQRKDSIEQFKQGQRQELVQKETKELEILQNYFPKQLSEEEITAVVKKIIDEVGAKGKKDFGQVMKAAMAQLAGKADGKLVNQVVSAQLNP